MQEKRGEQEKSRPSLSAYEKTIADQYVKVDDSLDRSRPETKSIPVTEFAKSVGMKAWCEFGVVLDEKKDPKLLTTAYPDTIVKLTDDEFSDIKTKIRTHSTKLVIRKKSPGNYGLFVEGTIPKDTYFAFYIGHLTEIRHESDYISMLTALDDTFLRGIDSKEYGNRARFMNHFPNATSAHPYDLDMSSYTFKSQAVAETVATQNVGRTGVLYKGIPFILFSTNRDVTNEELGYDYGVQYWESKSFSPDLYNKKGEVIPSASYDVKNPWLCVQDKNEETGLVGLLDLGKKSLDEIKILCKVYKGFPIKWAENRELTKLIPMEIIATALEKQKKESSPIIKISMLGQEPVVQVVPPDNSPKILMDFSNKGPIEIFKFEPEMPVQQKEVAKVQTTPSVVPALRSSSSSALPIHRDSPLNSPMTKIINSLDNYRRSKKTEAFFKAFDKEEYNKALRIACHSRSPEALLMIKILMDNHAVLHLNPNEKAGEKQLSAFDYAEEPGGDEIYKLLCSRFEDQRKVVNQNLLKAH